MLENPLKLARRSTDVPVVERVNDVSTYLFQSTLTFLAKSTTKHRFDASVCRNAVVN